MVRLSNRVTSVTETPQPNPRICREPFGRAQGERSVALSDPPPTQEPAESKFFASLASWRDYELNPKIYVPRKGAKHVLSDVEGNAKVRNVKVGAQHAAPLHGSRERFEPMTNDAQSVRPATG